MQPRIFNAICCNEHSLRLIEEYAASHEEKAFSVF